MSYSASIRPNMVVPFHRWTNCGPRQLHSEFGPNIHTTSIPAGPLMHCHCGTNNRAPRWTFTDPCKAEVRPGAREESASPAWLAAPAMNARNTTKVYIWRLDTGCGPTLYRKCHSHNTPGKRHNTLESNPSRGTVLPAPHGKGNKCDKNVKYKRTDALSLWHQQ